MSNKTILFADDSATMRIIMKKTFSAEPFDVVAVPSGEAAIAKARELRPDVIIVDAGMAGVSGYDVCQAVREDAAISDTPLLILSGVSNMYDESRGEAVGVDEHFKKPFDTGQLIDKVAMLAKKPRRAAPEPAAPEVPAGPRPFMMADEPFQQNDLAGLDVPLHDALIGEPEEEAHVELVEESRVGPVSAVPLVPLEEIPKKPVDEPMIGQRKPSKGTWEFPRPSQFLESLPKVDSHAVSVELPKPRSVPVEKPPAVAVVREEPDIGEEQPIATQDHELYIETGPEVEPIEIAETTHARDESGAFQVGTLAELAQMNNEGVPITPDAHEAAIELKPVVEPEETTIETAVRSRIESASAQLAKKVEAAVSPAQADEILAMTRDVIERVVWEVVPDLAETIIKEEIAKLFKE